VGQADSLDPTCLSNLIQTTEIVKDIKQNTGLYGGDSRRGGLQLPNAFRLCKEAVLERFGVPILGAVWEVRVANLNHD
jgi:hypothetical protein